MSGDNSVNGLFAWNFASEATTGDHASQYTSDKNINVDSPTGVDSNNLLVVGIIAGVLYMVWKGLKL